MEFYIQRSADGIQYFRSHRCRYRHPPYAFAWGVGACFHRYWRPPGAYGSLQHQIYRHYIAVLEWRRHRLFGEHCTVFVFGHSGGRQHRCYRHYGLRRLCFHIVAQLCNRCYRPHLPMAIFCRRRERVGGYFRSSCGNIFFHMHGIAIL